MTLKDKSIKLKLTRVNSNVWVLSSSKNPNILQIQTVNANDALVQAKNWLSSFPNLMTSTNIEVVDANTGTA